MISDDVLTEAARISGVPVERLEAALPSPGYTLLRIAGSPVSVRDDAHQTVAEILRIVEVTEDFNSKVLPVILHETRARWAAELN